ncbi:MAG: ATP-binding protein [Burkholderiales bacterium]|nr:ATP-binding protein [Burkholderiales bacterium]
MKNLQFILGLQNSTRSRLWLVYLAAVSLIVLLIVSLAAFSIDQEKRRYRERASIATQNIAGLLDRHMSDVFEKIDISLQAGAFFYTNQAASGRLDPKKINAYLANQTLLLPELDSLRIMDKEGFVRFGIKENRTDLVNLSDREYFIQARDSSDQKVVIAGPIFAKIAQKWVIVFARRINAPDGSFAGVIYANLPTVSFQTVFSSVALGKYGAATVRTTDLALVHRVPDTKNAVGSKGVSKQLAQAVELKPEGGTYLAPTALDGIERTNAYRRLKNYPFYVLVGLATDDYLGGWVESTVIVSGLAGLAILITLLAAILIFRAHRRLREDLAERTRISNELALSLTQRSELNAQLEVRMRQAEAANVAKNAFLANMSHEMMTPLHQIAGVAGLVKRGPLTERQSDWMRKLETASLRMAEIVETVLELTKMEADQLTLEETPVHLRAWLETFCLPYEQKAAEKSVTLLTDFSALPDLTLMADVKQIRVALRNYINNAVKFTERGEITVRVGLLEQDDFTATLKFEVQDTGVGIEPEALARLFSIFEQADNSSTRPHDGLGLGLAIVRKLAQLMGGQAGCDSRVGQGSCFWFTVRLKKAV